MKTAALIVAGGRGTRLGSDRPKQYIDLGGKTILARCLEMFLNHAQIDTVQVVIGAGDDALYRDATAGFASSHLCPPVTGGASRSASVFAGLQALSDIRPDRVLIHDAARPFCSNSVVSAVTAALDQTEGAFAALPVVDALWRAKDSFVEEAVPRDSLYRAQTPQGFHYDKIVAAYQAATGDAADDVAIAKHAGLSVQIVPGDEGNFKITTPADVIRAERHLQEAANDTA